jgi:fucose 4-O-acetylase-like acetyltransferase
MNDKVEVCYRQTRDLSIDIIKGIGIFCMVAGHSGSPITKFIYLFHMAIFFIASGYCYKTENSNSSILVFGFIKKKFLSLWFPYVLWTAIYSFLHNFFININVYTDNPLLLEYVSGTYISTTEYWNIFDILKNIFKGLLLRGGTQMGGAFWFIATLMELSIAYCVIDFIIKKLLEKNDTFKIQLIISIIFLCLGYGCYTINHSFFGIDKVLSYYILFHGGYAL